MTLFWIIGKCDDIITDAFSRYVLVNTICNIMIMSQYESIDVEIHGLTQ